MSIKDYNEKNTLNPAKHGDLSVVLAFPNSYYVGMSNLGFQFLYRQLNLCPGVVCERVFLPDAKTADSIKNSDKSLKSLESKKPVRAFNIVAFSICFENDYLNILEILKLSKIALLNKERSETDPLIIAGGISIILNPEPLSSFFDIFLIGEAEEIVAEFIDVFRKTQIDRKRIKPPLSAFADIKGVYVPSGYSLEYKNDGKIKNRTALSGYPASIETRKVSNLDNFNPCSCITTHNTEFSDMTLLEVNRGCPRACRFCAVGNLYKPYRKRSFENLVQNLALVPDTSRIGILGSAIADHPDFTKLIHYIAKKKGSVSLSSFRADRLTDEIAGILKQTGLKTFTIAPEAATQRLRDAIGKNLTDDEIFDAVAILARNKIESIKLYFITGLPWESDHDIEAIATMARKVKHLYSKELKSKRYLNRITVSLSIFVPKPWTTFQWHSFEDQKQIKRKLKTVVQSLKKDKKIVVVHEMPKWAYIQTLLSRGDRRTAALLLKTFENSYDWNKTFRESGLNPDFFVYRQRDNMEVLPWDFIDHKIDKKKLWEEYRKTFNQYACF